MFCLARRTEKENVNKNRLPDLFVMGDWQVVESRDIESMAKLFKGAKPKVPMKTSLYSPRGRHSDTVNHILCG